MWVLAPFRWLVVLLSACVLGGAFFERLVIVQLGVLTDVASHLAPHSLEAQSALLYEVFLYFLLYLINSFVWRCSGFCGMRVMTWASARSTNELFAHLTLHSSSYFHERFAGSLVSKISNVSRGVEQLLSKVTWEFIPIILGAIGNVVLLIMINASLAWLFVGWFFLFILVNALRTPRLALLSFRNAEAGSLYRGKCVDSISNIHAIHHAATARFEQGYLANFVEQMRASHLRVWSYSEWLLVTNGGMLAIFAAGMILLAGHLVISQQASVGKLTVVITMVFALQRALFFLGTRVSEAMGDYGQIKEGLGEILVDHQIRDDERATDLVISGGKITFEHVSFSYGPAPVFADLSLEINAGQKVGLVGVSGAGKSTLVSLLLRQYPLQAGRITIDQHDLSLATLDSVRRSIAVVPQQPLLFHRSILENIRYGRSDASDEDVRRAALAASADGFIRESVKGYEATVGERGVMLSGGQRQRIVIARAILKNAPILVLDEATSALDGESEQAIQQSLQQLMQGRTVIAIAHRLSTLRSMDRIVVLERGRITEDGHHDQLISAGGLYSRLWDRQVSGFLPE